MGVNDNRLENGLRFRYILTIVFVLYDLLMILALAAILPAYWLRLRVRKGQPLHLKKRLGLDLPRPGGKRPFLWIHAVSVGEVLSLQSLVGAVRDAHPDWEIGCSVLTNTGYAAARRTIRGADHLFFVPFDLGFSVKRVFSRFRPSLLVLVESEYWPRMLREARRRGCPVLVVNGRISGRTFSRMRCIRPLALRLLGRVDRFLVQTELDRDRLETLGVRPEKIRTSGNLKCETRLPALSAAELEAFKRELGIQSGDKVIVAGSIHPGEEPILLEAFRIARRGRPGLRLILAPRHPEKFAGFREAESGKGLAVQTRSGLDPSTGWDVLLLNAIGDLARTYAVADLAFVGGSLVPWGGQNLLEPAFYAKPIIFGPHMNNFAVLAETFELGGGAKTVRTPEEIASFFSFADLEAMAGMGRKAKEILTSLQGATGRAVTAIESLVGGPHA
ncbi:MAG: 3-deoxy-D-manno-octulosonic acid transferase [Candidatus Aminicenantes bacterium]|nr:3-deoxy-D-manno-octulosonic acid transferase [Candidatus Aminicenantes bacterium]